LAERLEGCKEQLGGLINKTKSGIEQGKEAAEKAKELFDMFKDKGRNL